MRTASSYRIRLCPEHTADRVLNDFKRPLHASSQTQVMHTRYQPGLNRLAFYDPTRSQDESMLFLGSPPPSLIIHYPG